MVDDVAESKKGRSAGAQAAAAVVLVGGVLGGMWGVGVFRLKPEGTRPAACASAHDAPPAQYVSGARLCTALNRPDLPALLGTPEDRALSTGSSGDLITLADSTSTAAPEATVGLTTYSVKLSASYDRLTVAQASGFLGGTAKKTVVLGHPAVLYSEHTVAFTFKGGKAGSGPGGIARHLVVARDVKDGGGFFELAVWRQDEVPPDVAALLRVADEVLPTVPGWNAG